MATSFNAKDFALRLITETLFYDEEYGAVGNLSLVDMETAKERFIAAYVPDEASFVIEEAVAWEDYEESEDDEIGYALAVDTSEHKTFETPDETAAEMLKLAETFNLTPSITLLFDDDDA